MTKAGVFRFFIALVILACLICIDGQAFSMEKNLRFVGKKLSTEYGYSVTASNNVECVIKCVFSTSVSCSGVSYNSESKLCLQYQNPLKVKYGDVEDEVVLTSLSIGSALFLAELVTSTDANDACVSIGGHLMTYSEMADAYHNNVGFDSRDINKLTGFVTDTTLAIQTLRPQDKTSKCVSTTSGSGSRSPEVLLNIRCGWNADGVARQITTTASSVSTGVSDCATRPTWRVWCQVDSF